LAWSPLPANRRDDGLLAATLDILSRDWLGPLPTQTTPTVHLDAGYDWQPCRDELDRRGLAAKIATRGTPASIQVGRRWVVERAHAWLNGLGSCAGAPSLSGVLARASLWW
jgi:hypothetical protein